jgi:hypothetical protein
MQKMFERFLLVFICIMAVSAYPAMAGLAGVQIDDILEYGMKSSFVVSTGTQTLSSLNGAKVFLDDGTIYTFSKTNLVSAFTGVTDTSSGGLASATFSSGTWQVLLYDPANASHLVFSMSGTTEWYREQEATDMANKVNGIGKIILSGTPYIDSAFWGSATWGSTDGKSAITSVITGAHRMPSGELLNYQTNWQSSNAAVVVWADSSHAVPEPATMSLLALGAAMFLRKRSSNK